MVVSWDNANDGREASVAGVVADGDPSSVLANQSNGGGNNDGDGPHLFHLARQAKWDELICRLESTQPDVIREQTDPTTTTASTTSTTSTTTTSEDEEGKDTLLHIVSVMESVPVKVVETILDRTSSVVQHDNTNGEELVESSSVRISSTSMAAKQNHLQQTPLHLAVVSIPERTDIIECLCHSCPESVHTRDAFRLRPIDIITQKIIMMEEVIKYSRRNEEKECRKMLNGLWQTVHVLVGATGVMRQGDRRRRSTWENNHHHHAVAPTFLVHACLRSKEVPFALTERAMKHNSDQLAMPDEKGDLPLHIVARIPPPVKRTTPQTPSTDGEDGDEDDENDDDEGDFLERVIDLCPEAAFHFNNEQQIPLVVAIHSGRKWNSGISLLLQVNPGGIEEARIPLNIFPFLLELLSKKQTITMMYQVLQSQPGLFLYSRGDSDSRISKNR